MSGDNEKDETSDGTSSSDEASFNCDLNETGDHDVGPLDWAGPLSPEEVVEHAQSNNNVTGSV